MIQLIITTIFVKNKGCTTTIHADTLPQDILSSWVFTILTAHHSDTRTYFYIRRVVRP